MLKKIGMGLAITILFLFFAVYYFFFDMSRLSEGSLIAEMSSPDGEYTVKAYVVSGGATVADSVRGELIFNELIRKNKNIYWNYREAEAQIIWVDNDTVSINGTVLDVPHEVFDFRRHGDDEH